MPAKKKFQDIIPAEKKSIRNIPLTSKQSRELKEVEEDKNFKTPVPDDEAASIPPRKRPPSTASRAPGGFSPQPENGKNKWIWWTIGGVVLIISALVLAHIFARATVAIARAEEPLTLNNATFPLQKDTGGGDAAISTSSIIYQSTTFNVEASTTVSANGQQSIQNKATGRITIYNTTSQAQLLIQTTRFSTAEGLIYHLNKNTTVPVQKIVNKKVIIGAIDADITADQAGDKYNLPIGKNLTLPGFKGSSKFTTIYAKTKTSISGGSIANVPQTSSTDLSAAKGLLNVHLRDLAVARANANLPEGYILAPDIMKIVPGEI